MKIEQKKESIFKSVTRGGQLLLHELHMVAQVMYKVVVCLLPIWIAVIIGWFFLATNSYQRYIGGQWLQANLYLLLGSEQHQQYFIQPGGHTIKLYSSSLLNIPLAREIVPILQKKIIDSVWVGLWSYLISVGGVVIWLYYRGKKQGAQKHMKGDYIATANEIKQLLSKQDKLSDLVVGVEKLILPRSSEMQHFLFHGTTGSGKSTGIKVFLDLIRTRGDRAIIYDKSCNLVEQFYDAKKDQLMNPLDERSVDWNLWPECRDKADFDSLAAALIPMPPSTQDPFWISAARTIFAAAAHRMAMMDNGNGKSPPRILPLLRYLLTADIDELQSLLKGTEAESLMSEKTEKTAISIKSVLATYLKSLCYIKDGDNIFSIRQWIQNDDASGNLFISSLGNKHESLKPLITAWLDIAVNALLSLTPNPKRRIWVILDELASLQQVPYLTTALSESRKFGGCFIIGIQSYAQLTKVYGHEGAKEISSLLNTRFLFRVPDPEIAHWSAKNLGEMILEEVREGISYGANSIRDGVSIQRVERQKPLVSDSEIIRLDDLSCYVRLPGGYPISKVHFPYLDRPVINIPFKGRVLQQDSLSEEVTKLAESMEVGDQKNQAEAKQNVSKERLIEENNNFKKELFDM